MAFKVERVEAEKFSKIWNKGGISIILSPEAIDFATDFGNIVLNNFIQVCQEQVRIAQKASPKAEEPNKLIIEGL